MRFGTPAVRAVFSDRALISRYIKVEVALARTESRCGVIPTDTADEIAARSTIDALDFRPPAPLRPTCRHTAIIIGHSRRRMGRSEGPATICQTLVSSDGSIGIAAASTGGNATAKRPIEIVGRPRPIASLKKPARRNAAAMKRYVASTTEV